MCQTYMRILKSESLLIAGITWMNNYHRMGACRLLKPHEREMLSYLLWLPRSNLPSNGYFASVASFRAKSIAHPLGIYPPLLESS